MFIGPAAFWPMAPTAPSSRPAVPPARLPASGWNSTVGCVIVSLSMISRSGFLPDVDGLGSPPPGSFSVIARMLSVRPFCSRTRCGPSTAIRVTCSGLSVRCVRPGVATVRVLTVSICGAVKPAGEQRVRPLRPTLLRPSESLSRVTGTPSWAVPSPWMACLTTYSSPK